MNPNRVVCMCILTVIAITGAMLQHHWRVLSVLADTPLRFSGPINSQPLALNADDSLMAVANPDNNSVSLFDVSSGKNTRVTEVSVGTEPNGVAVTGQPRKMK